MHKISNFPEFLFVVFVIESWHLELNLISMLSIGRYGLLVIVLQEMRKSYIWLELKVVAVALVVARFPAVVKTLTRQW